MAAAICDIKNARLGYMRPKKKNKIVGDIYLYI